MGIKWWFYEIITFFFWLFIFLAYLSGCATALYNQYNPDDKISNGLGGPTPEELLRIMAENALNSNTSYLYSSQFHLIFNASEQQITSLVGYRNKLYASTRQPNGTLYEYDPDTNISKVVLRTESPGINSLAVYDDKLFIAANSENGETIYIYNGTNILGVYDMGTYMGRPVYILSFYVQDNKLFAGAFDGFLFEFNGSNWTLHVLTNYSKDSPGAVRAITSYKDTLYAAVDNKVMTYNGTSGVTLYTSPEVSIDNKYESFTDFIYPMSMSVFLDSLFVGTYPRSIYEYDGTNLKLSYDENYQRSFDTLIVYKNKLYAGDSLSGRIYTYNGINWSLEDKLPERNDGVGSSVIFNNKLYLGSNRLGRVYEYIPENNIQ